MNQIYFPPEYGCRHVVVWIAWNTSKFENGDEEERIKCLLENIAPLDRVSFIKIPHDDIWIRDFHFVAERKSIFAVKGGNRTIKPFNGRLCKRGEKPKSKPEVERVGRSLQGVNRTIWIKKGLWKMSRRTIKGPIFDDDKVILAHVSFEEYENTDNLNIKVVQINLYAISLGGGGIHWMTQQQPAFPICEVKNMSGK